jgi:hypothetical protein
MRKLHLAAITVLLLACTAHASLHETSTDRAARPRSIEVATRYLPKAPPPNARLFSNAMLDPARCNYEYVDLYGSWVVRTELRLSCTTRQ